MTKGFYEEFKTVEVLINSATKTGRTDAFIISYTKLEKQIRRIFTYLVFQFPSFNLSQYQEILETIAGKRYLSFTNFIKGFDALYPKSFKAVVGNDTYEFLGPDFKRIKGYRNKILHGQPKGNNLSANDLKSEITIIQTWCSKVADTMAIEIGYDGLEWNSFRKNLDERLATKYKINISGVSDLDKFIENKMK